METFDVAIVGGGPAGSSCAAFCALAGLHTLVLERENFPREKVCGDCLNPSCWSVLERLGLQQQIRNLPHSKLDSVAFIAIDGHEVVVDLPTADDCELSVKRSLFDDLLLKRARELGAHVREGTTVTALANGGSWKIQTATAETFSAQTLIGADGRNSTVARLSSLLPQPTRERVALQALIPLPRDFGRRVVLQFLREGYSGQAPVNDTELNLCLVGTPPTISKLRQWANAKAARSPLINPDARARRLRVRQFLARTKISYSSATPPAWWSHLPAKEFTTLFARENWRRTRLRKSFGAKIGNQL